MELFTEVALATRLRRLAETLSTDAEALTQKSGVDLKAAQFYVVFALAQLGPQSMTQIAARSGFTHSAVSQQIKRLASDGYVALTGTDDGRQKEIALTAKGISAVDRLRPLWRTVETAVKNAITESGYDFMAALAALETAFSRSSLGARVDHLRGARPLGTVSLAPYSVDYRDAFAALNIDWLERYFTVEDIDQKALNDPDAYILNDGGEIWFALVDGRPLGTMALKHWGAGRFEFTKFAVDPDAQGHGLGRQLMQLAIDRFKARGGTTLFLETNTKLDAARAVYDRHGWVERAPPAPSPYARANCYMEWKPE